MWYIIVFVVGALAGFITGGLVYRNNKDKADDIVDIFDKE